MFSVLFIVLIVSGAASAQSSNAALSTSFVHQDYVVGRGERYTPAGVGDHMTDGVTIMVHGWNPSMAGTPAWLASMRDAIAVNFLGNEQNYGTITVTKPGASLVVTCSPWNIDLTSKTTGGILIILDWSAVSDHLHGGPPIQDVVTAVVDKIVTSQNGKPPLAELPIHIFGHSRGGALVAELAHQLGERGVVVDQLTLLDPHPLTITDPQPAGPQVIDTPLAVYENVVFADNYWQNYEYPKGESVGDAYNRLWGQMSGGYYDNIAPVYPNHRNILLMYQGSVDLGNPVNNGEASMDATERAAWFNTYEDNGDKTGFTYSRLDGGGDRTSAIKPVAGGDEIRAGLSSDAAFGGSGGRSNLVWSSAVWPNLAKLDVLDNSVILGPGTHVVIIGTSLQLHYVYLDYDSGVTVMLRVDADRNPYNNNDVADISTQVFPSATGETYTQDTEDWDTSAMSNGITGYVYAKVTDGTRTRYLYAAPVLQFQNAVSGYNSYLPLVIR
jgi:pimeloyl-ACP methyl ester carboxylesterase